MHVPVDMAASPIRQQSPTDEAGRERLSGTFPVAKPVSWRVVCLPDGQNGRSWGECRLKVICNPDPAKVRPVTATEINRRPCRPTRNPKSLRKDPFQDAPAHVNFLPRRAPWTAAPDPMDLRHPLQQSRIGTVPPGGSATARRVAGRRCFPQSHTGRALYRREA